MQRFAIPVPVFAAALAAVLSGTAAQAQISFAPAVNYAAATQPNGVALANFGGDNRPDLAITADTPNRVEIRLNNGTGSFGAPVSVPVGAGTGIHSLAALDIDGDTGADLVVTLHNTSQVRILVNNAGVFTAGAVIGVGGGDPRFLAAGDLDNDDLADVVTSNRTSGDISVLINTGGGLGAPAVSPVGGNPRGVALGDVDGDLRPSWWRARTGAPSRYCSTSRARRASSPLDRASRSVRSCARTASPSRTSTTTATRMWSPRPRAMA